MTKRQLEAYIFDKYGVEGDYPWDDSPNAEVFRHQNNKKWFALIMRIPISKFGIYENRQVNVVNLKIVDEVLDCVWQEDGIFPAYHMNKNHWISVMLDGSVEESVVKALVDASFDATASKIKRKHKTEAEL